MKAHTNGRRPLDVASIYDAQALSIRNGLCYSVMSEDGRVIATTSPKAMTVMPWAKNKIDAQGRFAEEMTEQQFDAWYAALRAHRTHA